MTPDLATTYLGLPLRSPLVVGAAAPLSDDLAQLQALEAALNGTGALAASEIASDTSCETSFFICARASSSSTPRSIRMAA